MDPAEFFGHCERAFERAAEKFCGDDLWLTLADRPVRLRYAGGGMRAFIEPSFGHLRMALAPIAPVGTAFTIMVWDYHETGEAIPPRPWLPEAEGVLGRVAAFGEPRFAAMVDLGETQVWMHDRERNIAFLWIRDGRRLPPWDKIHPLRQLLDAWADHLGLQMIHAGAAGTSKGGVLVVGPGGAGKSTTVLATMASGGRAAGDDYVLVGNAAGNGGLVAYSLYDSMRLFESHRDRFPHLMLHPDETEAAGNGRPKLTSYMSVHRPGAVVASLPISAIVIPRPAPGRRTRAQRESGGKALFALAPSTLKQLDPGNARALSRMGALCRALPCWSLELGDDIDAVAPTIDAIITQATAT